MSDFKPSPQVSTPEICQVEEEKGRVHSFIGNVTNVALSLYGNVKERSPQTLRDQLDTIENKVEPYREPALAKWKEHAEPLVDVIEATLEENIVPQAKAVETSIVGAVAVVNGKVNQVQDTVKSRVVQPCVEVKDQIVAYTHVRSSEVVEAANDKAMQALDYVLPDYEEELAEKEPLPPQKQLVSRLSQRAGVVTELLNELSYKYLPDEENTSRTFSKVIEVLPNSETSEKVVGNVLHVCPPTLMPFVSKGVILAQPALDFTFDRLLRAVLLTRKLVLTAPPKAVPAIKQDADGEDAGLSSQELFVQD